MNDRDHTARLLAESVLGQDDGLRAGMTGLDAVSHCSPTVRIELRSIVRGICQQVWVDQAAIAKAITEEVERAASEVDLMKCVREAVAAEVARARQDIERRVREKIASMLDWEIGQAIGSGPKLLAQRVAGRMWRALDRAETKRRAR